MKLTFGMFKFWDLVDASIHTSDESDIVQKLLVALYTRLTGRYIRLLSTTPTLCSLYSRLIFDYMVRSSRLDLQYIYISFHLQALISHFSLTNISLAAKAVYPLLLTFMHLMLQALSFSHALLAASLLHPNGIS